MPSQNGNGPRGGPWGSGAKPDLEDLVRQGLDRLKKLMPGGGRVMTGFFLVSGRAGLPPQGVAKLLSFVRLKRMNITSIAIPFGTSGASSCDGCANRDRNESDRDQLVIYMHASAA